MKKFLKFVLLVALVAVVIRWFLGRSKQQESAEPGDDTAEERTQHASASESAEVASPGLVASLDEEPGEGDEAPSVSLSAEPPADAAAGFAPQEEGNPVAAAVTPTPVAGADEHDEAAAPAAPDSWEVALIAPVDSQPTDAGSLARDDGHAIAGAVAGDVRPPDGQVEAQKREEAASFAPSVNAPSEPVAEVAAESTDVPDAAAARDGHEDQSLEGEWVPVSSVAEAYEAWRTAEQVKHPAPSAGEAPQAWAPSALGTPRSILSDSRPLARWWATDADDERKVEEDAAVVELTAPAVEPAADEEAPVAATPWWRTENRGDQADAPASDSVTSLEPVSEPIVAFPEPATGDEEASPAVSPWWVSDRRQESVDVVIEEEGGVAEPVAENRPAEPEQTVPWWQVAATEEQEEIVEEEQWATEPALGEAIDTRPTPSWRAGAEEGLLDAGADQATEPAQPAAVQPQPEDTTPWWRVAAIEEAEAFVEATAAVDDSEAPAPTASEPHTVPVASDPWARWSEAAFDKTESESESTRAESEHIRGEMTAISSAFDELASEAEVLAEEERWLDQAAGRGQEAATEEPVPTTALAADDEVAARGFIDEGNAFYEIEAFELAEHRYSRAVAAAPGLPDAHYNRANARVRLGDLDGALADFNRAIELAPGDPDALNNRGMLYLSASESELALKDFEAAVALREADPTLLVNLGVALTEVRRFTEALRTFERAVVIDPRDAAARYGAARAAARLSEYDRAVAHVREALDLDPSFREEMVNDPMLESLRSVAAFSNLMRPEGARF